LRRGTKPMAIHKIPRGTYSKPHFTRDDKFIIFSYRPRANQGRSIMSIELAPMAVAKRIVNNPKSDDHSAIPSPTRDEIAFVSNRDGTHDIFLAPIGPGTPVNLTKGSKSADFAPLWSPDGEKIAYVSVPGELFEAEGDQHSKSTIRVIDRTGKLLFETAGTMPDWMPAWSGNQPTSSTVDAKP